jgi:hypothetical protein
MRHDVHFPGKLIVTSWIVEIAGRKAGRPLPSQASMRYFAPSRIITRWLFTAAMHMHFRPPLFTHISPRPIPGQAVAPILWDDSDIESGRD